MSDMNYHSKESEVYLYEQIGQTCWSEETAVLLRSQSSGTWKCFLMWCLEKASTFLPEMDA